MLSVFLSHNHSDKPFARRLAERLKAHGVRVWLDEAEMQVGDSLVSKIESAIRECTYLGVILSPSSVASQWVQREVNMALSEEIHGRRIKVLPLLHKPCEIPGFLKDKLYADFSEDFDSGLRVLLERLDSDLHEESYRQKRAYEILQTGYQDWVAFSKEDSHLLDRPTIDLVVQHVSEPLLSLNLIEYLLCSISLAQPANLAPEDLHRLREWVGGNSVPLVEKLVHHGNPTVRVGSLSLFGLLGDDSVTDEVLRVACEDTNQDVKRTALATVSQLGRQLPEAVARELLESDSDWVVQSYALRGAPDKQCCLLVSDGTEFATGMGSIAEDAGFHVVSLPTSPGSFELASLRGHLLQSYSLLVVVRGEHFTQYGNERFYELLREFVRTGGILFATSWVSWETKYQYEFTEVLPFRHIRDTYNEGVRVTCAPTQERFAQELLAKPVSYYTSFELLETKDGSSVLLEAPGSVPLLGYRHFGSGLCYYFNTCQHFCLGHMASPLSASPELHSALSKLLARIHGDVVKRQASRKIANDPSQVS